MSEPFKKRARGGGGGPAGAHQLLVKLQEALYVLVLDAGAFYGLYQQLSELYSRVHGPNRRPAAMGASCGGRAAFFLSLLSVSSLFSLYAQRRRGPRPAR
jgi:hypothetical protein